MFEWRIFKYAHYYFETSLNEKLDKAKGELNSFWASVSFMYKPVTTDLDCQSIYWSHYGGGICLKWVKMKLQYAICFKLIGKTSGIIWFDGMHDSDNKTMGYGWK